MFYIINNLNFKLHLTILSASCCVQVFGYLFLLTRTLQNLYLKKKGAEALSWQYYSYFINVYEINMFK